MAELAQEAQTGRMRIARLSRAFGALLRYAGARISDDEVYTGMFEGGPGTIRDRIIAGVNTLMALMVPPVVEAAPRGNVSAVVAKPSRRSTKRSSVRVG